MSDVSPFRSNIQTEDVQFRASVSEAVGNKIGAAINMINNYQHIVMDFKFNGPYSSLSTPQTGVDGAFVMSENCEIYSITMSNLVAGSSGSLQIDLIRHTSSGTTGSSIFTTLPTLPYTTGNNAYLGYRFSDSTVLQNPSGCTLPTVSSINLNAGDMITCNIVNAQTDGQNANITLKIRVRN